jgi:hypothetical protein
VLTINNPVQVRATAADPTSTAATSAVYAGVL